MLEKIVQFILSWGLEKFWAFIKQLTKKYYSKLKINKEVDEEEDPVKEVLKEIDEYMEAHPEETRVPENLSKKLDDATKRRNDGLRRGL